MSTVTIAPIEEKVAVLDDKKARVPGGSSNRDYVMKFVCAAMSSE